jgi:signal transduction histidine kinase
MSLVDRLREVPLLADLPDDDLERLCRGSEEVHLAAGELLFSEGDEGDRAFVVLDGELEVVKAALGREVLLARHTQGVVGEMALLENAPRNASVRAGTDTTLLAIPKSRLDELLDSSPSASRAFFEVMLARWRDTRASLQHTERMAQLGTLTAGLAHELNNPAAAVNRSADQLSEALVRHADATIAAATGLEEESAAVVARVVEDLRVRAGVGASLSAIDRSDAENQVGSWLDDNGIDRSWALAPGLVDAGFTEQELTALSTDLGGAKLAEVIELIDATHDQLSILHQIEEGTRRISSIVKALRSYSYLDRAPVQDVDVTVGLEDTLLLLEHKTKDITVERRYSDDLPVIEALGSELNQVWTNLIDNAIYALHDSDIADPRLVVRTIATDNGVAVEIEDNGPGIPTEIQGRIFDSFFTTKPPGSGSGLGLDISQNIVVQHHGGDLTVESRPGRTVARVELPRELPKRNV